MSVGKVSRGVAPRRSQMMSASKKSHRLAAERNRPMWTRRLTATQKHTLALSISLHGHRSRLSGQSIVLSFDSSFPLLRTLQDDVLPPRWNLGNAPSRAIFYAVVVTKARFTMTIKRSSSFGSIEVCLADHITTLIELPPWSTHTSPTTTTRQQLCRRSWASTFQGFK